MADGIHFNMEPVVKKLKALEKAAPDIGREAVRAGCRAAGLYIRRGVKACVPILKPENIWNEWPLKYSKGRRRSRTSTGQHLPLVAGELRDSIYFTYSPRNSFIPGGVMTYLVGFPHSHGGTKMVKGWYGHFVNNGHTVLNYPVNLRDTPAGKAKAKRLGVEPGVYPGKMGARISWVEGKYSNFIGRGYDNTKAGAQRLMEHAAEKKIKQMLKERGF